jgi:hypothetical protein
VSKGGEDIGFDPVKSDCEYNVLKGTPIDRSPLPARRVSVMRTMATVDCCHPSFLSLTDGMAEALTVQQIA